MWSDGGVEGLSEPLFGGGVAPRESARHLWASSSRLLDQTTTTEHQVSSSTSLPQEDGAVDLSIKPQVANTTVTLEGMRSSLQTAILERTKKGLLELSGTELRRLSSDDEGGRLVIVESASVPEGSDSPITPPPSFTQTAAAQTEQRDFNSVKEVLLEMKQRKNGHNLILPTKWGIMKKEVDHVLLKVPKYVVDEKKGIFPRPTALVNPLPSEMPINGSVGLTINGLANVQTSIKDWLNGKKIEIPPKETTKACTGSKTKSARQRMPKGSNGKIITSRKKPLTTIVAQLTGNVQNSQTTPVDQTDPGILQKLLAPPAESVSFLSPHRLTGGEVSISEVTPDMSVVDRLKRLGTVIEIEDQAEHNSLKLLEKMTKSVSSDKEKSKTLPQQLPKTASSQQQVHQKSIVQLSQQPTKLQSLQFSSTLQVSSQMPKANSLHVPSECLNEQPLQTEQSQSPTREQPPKIPSVQKSLKKEPMNKTQTVNKLQKVQSTSPSLQVQTASQTLGQPVLPKTSKPHYSKVSKILQNNESPKVQLAGPKSSNKIQNMKSTKSKNNHVLKVQQFKIPNPSSHQVALMQPVPTPISALPLTTLYISKDVTLIPKLPIQNAHDKIEPSLLEPVIDIVEEEQILSQDGTFLFKTDSYYSVDLHNEQKIFSCDICSAVYTHSNMLRKHYLRLHIARKYISERDMETFNIDPEPVNENNSGKRIFRCHTCRECFATKNDLRSHLTDHPPVVGLMKGNNKLHTIYKCDNCSTMFKWRKQFGRHKKLCKPVPPPPSEKPDLFHCLYCNETFLNGNAKRNHILSTHPYVRRKHCCVFCKRDGFPTNVSLFHHLLNDHQTVYFACQECKERFTNLEDLKAHHDKKHDQDEQLKNSLSERVSTLKQEKDYYGCNKCQRKFLIEASFKDHICFPEKLEKTKPKLQKIKKKVYTLSERSDKPSKNVDLETLFYSRVAGNVQDNLLNHLDGKIYKDELLENDQSTDKQPSNVSPRTFLNFSASFPSSSEIQTDQSGTDTPTRVKAPWEKYNFPKNYDGRCGLTSYIKDTSYLDISTQLIMRSNLQRLNMLPMRESPPDDVPSVLALERLGAECAESFGQPKSEKTDGEDSQELGELSGEWIRERMYVCSACRWETPCLWTMEDHKYLSHPRVHCPQHELIGEEANLSKTIYKRLTEVPTPFKGTPAPTPPVLSTVTCTKCSKTGFTNQTDLHVHILECAGVVVEAVGPIGSTRRKKRRTRRRPRRGLKRNIPSTPQKLPPKQRTKPGDTDTIQRMIANLPAKRVSKKVFNAEDEKAKLVQNIPKNPPPKGNKKKTSTGKRCQSEPPRTPIKDQPDQQIIRKPTVIKKEQDYIDTSAEGGDVLSSLRMMPVRPSRTLNGLQDVDSSVKKEYALSNQSEDKEMPKLEIEKDISPVESTEIPVLSPVERKDDIKKEKDDLICGISFVDGVIKYETVSSVSQETEKLDSAARKRKSSTTVAQSPVGPKSKKVCKEKNESQISTRSKVKADIPTNTPSNNKSPSRTGLRKQSKDAIKIEDSKNEIPKKRGRPKGSLTKKPSVCTKRRSMRNTLNNETSEVKFDEILPCDEVEKEIVKKPEKPKRKPRTVKSDPPTSDSTIIVVHAEIHPEPVLKKRASLHDEYNESDTKIKKVKGGLKLDKQEELKPKEDVIAPKPTLDISDDDVKSNDITNNIGNHIEPEVQSSCDSTPLEIDVPTPNGKKDVKEILQTQDTIILQETVASTLSDIGDSKTMPEHCKESGNDKSLKEELNDKNSVINDKNSIKSNVNESSNNFEIPDVEINSNNDISHNDSNDLVKEIKCEDDNEVNIISGNENCSKVDLVPNDIKLVEEDNQDNIKTIHKIVDNNQVEICSVLEKTDAEPKLDIKIEEIVENNNVNTTEGVLELVTTPAIDKQSVKKRKLTKKSQKTKKRSLKKEVINSHQNLEELDDQSGVLISEKKDNPEKEKPKKIKKQLKRDSVDLPETKKIKKPIKRKRVKKMVKLKKRSQNKCNPVSEVLNIAGFKWEVSELELQPVVESSSEPVQTLPDSSVLEPLLEQEIPLIQDQPLLPVQNPPTTTFVQNVQPSTSNQPTQLTCHPPTTMPLSNIRSWENTTPWEPPTPDPSLGTIIDSVNKLLSDSESTYTPLGLPSYSLADLQKAMGASDDEMAVLQQLGEASIQIASNEGSCSGSMRSCDPDDWNNEKFIMDLDNPAAVQKIPESSKAPVPQCPPSGPTESVDTKDSTQEWRWRDKTPPASLGSSSLLEAHQGKEVLCPSCSCHFMGFPALQRHLAKAHATEGPTRQKRGSGTTFTKTDVNRRMPLDSSQSPRLICFTCQQILPADRMSLHLEQEHAFSPDEVSKCSSLTGECHDGPVVGDRLKSKMSSKLGDLLDRAVNNLLQAKHKPNNTLSGGAVDLLTKLCAVRKREGSVKHRLFGARELLSKLHRTHEMRSSEDGIDEKPVKLAKLFSCSICGHKFTLPSSRNKHEVLAHRSYRPPAEFELEEYENDWREAPSPPEIKGENGTENAIFPQCSDCGLSFDTIQEMMKHRVEDHTTRRMSVDTSNNNTGCCPSPVPSSGGSRSLPDSETEGGGGDSDATAPLGRRRKSTRKVRLSQSGSKSVKERAEAALRELNHPRQRTEKRWLTNLKQQKAADVYNFTDESL